MAIKKGPLAPHIWMMCRVLGRRWVGCLEAANTADELQEETNVNAIGVLESAHGVSSEFGIAVGAWANGAKHAAPSFMVDVDGKRMVAICELELCVDASRAEQLKVRSGKTGSICECLCLDSLGVRHGCSRGCCVMLDGKAGAGGVSSV